MNVAPARDMDGIAILAAACRFPGAPTLERFWSNLCAGVESVRRYTPDELDAAGVPRHTSAAPRFVPVGALLDDVAGFDAALFGFTPREAAILDPQHRLFFECVWEVLERGGYVPGSVAAPVGLFAGTSFSSYLLHNLIPEAAAIGAAGLYQTYITNDKDSLTTYVAYKLHLRGPCVTLQTACSTSLVAVQFACQSLLGFQCDMAIAGGVSLQIPHLPGYMYQEGAIASPDGHCRPFDAAAAGTVPGSGVGAVLLKRLEDALADGDPILAVIRGGAVNNDGAAKVGYTAPGADGQAEVIALAHAVAGTPAETIGYVEGHGTGTPLGDPIEVAALTRVFTARTSRRQFCALGSVKSNIGHLDAAAGIAGVIKAALAVAHGVIPASLHFDTPNPRGGLADGPFFVPRERTPWPAGNVPRRAAVSSFGIGGTNAHVVLEEPPAPEPPSSSRPVQILSVSARSAASLERLALNLADCLAAPESPPLADTAFTLHVGRRAWPHRLSIVSRTREDAAIALRAPALARDTALAGPEPTAVGFLFPGQGTQHPGMLRGIYEREQVLRAEVDASCAHLRPLLGLDLRELLLAATPSASARLTQTALAQPALFVVEYALARLWMSWGVRPDGLIGHSLGEYTAACIAGVFSRDDGLSLVAARGRLMQSLPPGAMLAVAAPARDLSALMGPGLSVAAINGPDSTVASGGHDAVHLLEASLTARGIAHRRLQTSHAFHSPMMSPIVEAFRVEAARIRLSAPTIPFVSNVTGDWITEPDATDPSYWARHLRETVMFERGLGTLLDDGRLVPLEVGPGRTLAGLVRQMPANGRRRDPVSSLPRHDETLPPEEALADATSRLWLQGAALDWTAYYAGERRRRVLVPTTPFEHQRHWVDAPSDASTRRGDAAGDPAERWLYVPDWRIAPATTAASPLAPTVIIVGTGPAATGFASHARSLGHTTHVLHAESALDVRQRLADLLRDGGRLPDHSCICALGALIDSGDEWTPAEAERRALDIPLALVQGLAAAHVSTPLTMLLPVNRMYDAVAPGPATPVFAPLRGLLGGPALVVPQEYPNLTVRIVDLDTSAPASEHGWVRELGAELTTTAADPVVAYRAGDRYTRGFRQAALGVPGSRFDRGGIYWITGATGGMGQSLAWHLAHKFQAGLLLTARGAVPAELLAEIEAAGAAAVACTADASDPAAMDAAVAAAMRRFGRIDGVIHAAGVPGGGVIALRGKATPDVLAAKVSGTLVVADAARAAGAGFLALCSSLSTVLGGLGQVDYVAANAFIDQFAAWHSRTYNLPTIAIGWDAWRESGMAVTAQAQLRQRTGTAGARTDDESREGLSTAAGLALFERIVSHGTPPHIAVSTVPLEARRQHHRDATSALTAMAGGGTGEGRKRGELDALSVEAQVAALWERVLGVPDIAPEASFFDVGGDSLKGVQLVAQLNEHFGLAIPVGQFFGAPTIASLAALIRDTGHAGTSAAADPALEASRERGRLRGARRGRREPA